MTDTEIRDYINSFIVIKGSQRIIRNIQFLQFRIFSKIKGFNTVLGDIQFLKIFKVLDTFQIHDANVLYIN